MGVGGVDGQVYVNLAEPREGKIVPRGTGRYGERGEERTNVPCKDFLKRSEETT